MNKIGKVGIIFCLVFCGIESLATEKNVECTHFWLKGNERIASGKQVGVDVGTSPYGPNGVYECKVLINRQDIIEGRVLFIGEVGDASYVQPISGPDGLLQSLPIYHGLSPTSPSSTRYLRFLPFVISLRDFYQRDGWHKFELYYKDLVPRQTGLRSGPPTIENVQGAIRRALVNAPSFTIHIAQILIFLLIAIGILQIRAIPLLKRILLMISAIASGSIILSISAIPRFFFADPNLALRLNNVINIVGFSTVFLPLASYFELNPKGSMTRVSRLVVGAAILSSFGYWWLATEGIVAYRFYSVMLLVFGAIYPLSLYFLWRIGRLRPTFSISPKSVGFTGHFLLLWALMMVWDAGVNMLLLNIRFQFFLTHFLYFLPALLWQIGLQIKEIESEKILPSKIEEIKNESLRKIAIDPKDSNILKDMCFKLGALADCERISIGEVLENQIKFMGTYGPFEIHEILHSLNPNSQIRVAIAENQLRIGLARSFQNVENSDNGLIPIKSEYYIVPLKHQGKVRGALCLTNFKSGYLSPFLRDRLILLKNSVEILFSMVMLERDNRAQANLLHTARLSISAIQMRSEKYFLDHFQVSTIFQKPTFIVGDLADSTPLNLVYGAQKTKSVINEFLSFIFEKFKNFGIIISCRNGDEISIVLPNLQIDPDEISNHERILKIIQYLSYEDDLARIAKSHGIGTPFEFKYAASQAHIQEMGEDVPSAIGLVSTVTDSEIDSTYRVISKVALPGECLLLPRLAIQVKNSANLIQISNERLKGISKTMTLYSLSRNAKSISA